MRKTIVLMLTSLLALCIGLSGCSDGINSNPGTSTDKNGMSVDPNLPPVQEGQIRINCAYPNAQNLWVWDDFAASEVDKCADWNTSDAVTLTGTNGDFKYFDVKLADNPKQVSFIIRSAKGNNKLTEKDLIFIFPNKYNEIYVVDGKIMVTTSDKSTGKVSLSNPKGLASGSIVDENTIKLVGDGISLSDKNITVKNGDKTLAVSSISGMTLTTSESLRNYGMVDISYTDEMGTDTITAIPDDTLLDEWFNMDITKLGYADGVFTTWAPLASKVQVLLYETAASLDDSTYSPKEIPMIRQTDGTWKTEDVSADVAGKNYYKYRIRNGNYSYDVCDIWAKVASKNSEATQIVSIDDPSAKPAGWNSEYENPFSDGSVKYYSDAIIYEMHIRDWSMAMDKNSAGSFDEIAEAMKTGGTLYNHLKELGVTHVQILPMFEYAKVGTDDTAYNWGYNPYNWNTPETRYVKSMTDGTDAVKSMRSMIQAFHDAGIAVNMDVVYNHTSGTKNGSIYDMTVPKYFYRTNGDTYLNGSGCGNETNSENEMFKKYMIDSLKHWMTDYHINGFRFDLMGVHDKYTMEEVYKELVKIDQNVMVYGEPWTAGDKNASIATEGAISVGNTNGVAAFDDDFRDAIKGAEYGGFNKGQVQGYYNDSGIIKGLSGASGKNKRNTTGRPALSLHYVECHDNYTLADKLCYSTVGSSIIGKDDIVKYFKSFSELDETKQALVKAQNKLSAAYVFLAQGTPFINGGQEFMRTKKGNPDSYAADTKGGYKWSETEILECNAVDLSYKETYSDVYNTYKGLIALRKANSVAFGHNGGAHAERVSDGVTKYTTGDFLVYFNATDAAVPIIDASGYSTAVDVSSGTPTDVLVPTKVAAKSFVILKK